MQNTTEAQNNNFAVLLLWVTALLVYIAHICCCSSSLPSIYGALLCRFHKCLLYSRCWFFSPIWPNSALYLTSLYHLHTYIFLCAPAFTWKVNIEDTVYRCAVAIPSSAFIVSPDMCRHVRLRSCLRSYASVMFTCSASTHTHTHAHVYKQN